MDLGAARPGSADPSQHAFFMLSVAAVTVSIVVFVGLVVGAACGGNDPGALAAAGVGTATPEATRDAPTGTPTPTSAPSASATVPPAQTPGGSAQGDGATEPEDTATLVPCTLLAPVDQDHRVARDCAPGGGGTRAAYDQMVGAAAKEGIELRDISGYRSYDTQAAIYNEDVRLYGNDQPLSAKPGHSEHQLGSTIDFNEIDDGFGDTAAGKWLAKNAVKFGFVMSYPPGRTGETGYAYEPWHFRYIGLELAAAQQASGLTLNNFLASR